MDYFVGPVIKLRSARRAIDNDSHSDHHDYHRHCNFYFNSRYSKDTDSPGGMGCNSNRSSFSIKDNTHGLLPEKDNNINSRVDEHANSQTNASATDRCKESIDARSRFHQAADGRAYSDRLPATYRRAATTR